MLNKQKRRFIKKMAFFCQPSFFLIPKEKGHLNQLNLVTQFSWFHFLSKSFFNLKGI